MSTLTRAPHFKFWLQKIMARILCKMRLRDKTHQKDIANHCNVAYFLPCMPLASKQTAQWVDSMSLLQSKELAEWHARTWTTMEAIMRQIQEQKGVVGPDLDGAFDKLYAEFSAFTDLYRFTVVCAPFFSVRFCPWLMPCPPPTALQLNGEFVTLCKTKELLLNTKDDLLALDREPALKRFMVGAQLRDKLEGLMATHGKRITQLAGAAGFTFFEQGALREKNTPTAPLESRLSLFMDPTDPQAMHEAVHAHLFGSQWISKNHKVAPAAIWENPRVQELYEK